MNGWIPPESSLVDKPVCMCVVVCVNGVGRDAGWPRDVPLARRAH